MLPEEKKVKVSSTEVIKVRVNKEVMKKVREYALAENRSLASAFGHLLLLGYKTATKRHWGK